MTIVTADSFLSTPSSQRATLMGHTTRPISEISIHALFAEGDLLQHVKQLLVGISIHALFAEGDLGAIAAKMEDDDFYPRPLRRGRPTTLSFWRTRHEFLSTPSSQRATRLCCARRQRRRHFYPRPLRRGRRRSSETCSTGMSIFLSTPSSQRATPAKHCGMHRRRSFLSTPSSQRATLCQDAPPISHPGFLSTPSSQRATEHRRAAARRGGGFLSTPSSQRATSPPCSLRSQ